MVSGKRRCNAWKRIMSKKKSSVIKHIVSQKHIKSGKVIAKSKKKNII